MGSSSSKSLDSEAAVHRRSFSTNVFTASCIRPPSGSSDNTDIDHNDNDDEQVSDHQPRQNDTEGNLSNMISLKAKGQLDRNNKVKMKRAEKQRRVVSEPHYGKWCESSTSRNRHDSSHNPSSNFLSRFNVLSSNVSSRSSREHPESSTSSIVSNDDHLRSRRFSNKGRTRHGCQFIRSCFMPMSPRRQDNDSNSDSGSSSDNSDASSIHELGPDGNNNSEIRNGFGYGGNRRMQARERVEQNVRFSRTLSVGRLRDRVIHRPAFPELASLPLQSEQEVVNGVDIRDNEIAMMATTSSSYSSSAMTNSLYGNHDFEVEYTGAREASYTSLLEHRANFLERRRRIRSQVRALQRMGSRFENLSGHERSCILSGQHRTGHCTCRNNLDPNDGANARGSISRIVLLTEALFEVLDELRQHSAVSSSQPALSSIGSVPTPIEVVEALPLELHRKLSKHLNEDDAQCQVCLVEYENGDEVRVLPCHHEFHRLCIDKWLKEIHRICPLCRGDVCKAGSLHAEGSQL